MNTLDRIQADAAIVVNTTSSVAYSQSFSMNGCHGAEALIQVGTILSTGITLKAAWLGGDSTTAPSAMSSIANAEINLCTSSTQGIIQDAYAVQIRIASSAAATLASAVTLNFGTSTFVSDSTASSTGGKFLTGLASVVAKSLTTLIQTWYPQYNTTYSSTGADTCLVDVSLNNIGADTTGIYVKTTAQTTITGIMAYYTKKIGRLSLPPAHLVATASSFTNFALRISCTDSSVIPFSAVILRDMGYVPNQIGPHKRDLTTSGLI